MERFIGLDAHLSSCVFAVRGPSGRRIRTEIVETDAKVLMDFVRKVPKPRYLCLEEGTMSEWLYEVLSPCVDEIYVVVPEKKKGNKSDVQDALDLAEMVRVGSAARRVFKGCGRFRILRELSRVYTKLVVDQGRVKNRIKSQYRSRGVDTGESIYHETHRKQWLDRLPHATRLATLPLYEQLDALLPIVDRARQELIKESRRHRITRILKTCPGIGEIRVAQAVATVVTPHRFRTKRQFWCYCGLGIVTRASSEWEKRGGEWSRREVQLTRGLNRNYNRLLKSVFKGAAKTAINRAKPSPLRESYERQLEHTSPNLARLTVARKIAATFLAMWKSEEVYDPHKSCA
jgi:transposase